jgi:hypothetical protein
MSKLIQIKIDSVLGGISPTKYLSQEQQFLDSIAIDPEFPITDTGVRPSGIIKPVAYESFSGANVTAKPMFIVTNPINSLVYVGLSNGRFLSYSATLGSETLIDSSQSAINGMAYYNDYIYIATDANVCRYGPLSGSPSFTANVWTGATLGSLTALTNTTYPSLRNTGTYPNHVMFRHVNNVLYLLDYKSGVGYIHYVKTTATGGTNDTSVYNALDLPYGYMPTSGCSFGNDIVVTAIQTTSTTTYQGASALFFWDTVDTSFYRVVPIDGVATAVHNVNGIIYVWAGSVSGNGGHVLYRYVGGDSMQVVKTISEGYPPAHGAVATIGSRISWGSFKTDPENAAVVYSYGSKDGTLPESLNCVARSTITANATDGQVTALKYALQGTFSRPALVIGAKNDNTSTYTLDKLSTTYQTHYWRSKMYNLDVEFDIKKINIPLGVAVATNMTLTPKLYLDDESKTVTQKVVNSTNFPNSDRIISLYPRGAQGYNNFYLELKWTGTVNMPVLLPITVELEVKTD